MSDNISDLPEWRILPGLPPYGPIAKAFPESWGRTGQEGVVVEFRAGVDDTWVANFRGGSSPATSLHRHPDRAYVLVLAGGDAWIVDPKSRDARLLDKTIDRVWELNPPPDLVLSWQGLAFIRLGATGIVWHTRRISWDGFDQVRMTDHAIEGQAWTPLGDVWVPFSVDLASGTSQGGSFSDGDPEGWEKLNE